MADAGILAAGDLADVPAGEQAVLESVGSGEGDASVVISGLESIICRVVYIPGNVRAPRACRRDVAPRAAIDAADADCSPAPAQHDPISMLDLKSTPQLTSHSTNVHNRALQVLPGLTVLGFGGSVPAYKDGEQVWRGFPYTEEHMEAGLGDLLSPTAAVSGGAGGDDGEAGAGGDGGAVGKGEFAGEVAEFAPHHAGSLPTLGHAATTAHAPPGDDIILMTHVGPQGVATTLDDSKDPGGPPISSGSAALRRALLDPALQERVIANVHGHTHHAPGQAWLGGVRVINPGSLRYGANFCLLSLKRRDEASRWRVVATEFHTLP